MNLPLHLFLHLSVTSPILSLMLIPPICSSLTSTGEARGCDGGKKQKPKNGGSTELYRDDSSQCPTIQLTGSQDR